MFFGRTWRSALEADLSFEDLFSEKEEEEEEKRPWTPGSRRLEEAGRRDFSRRYLFGDTLQSMACILCILSVY